MRKIQNYNQTYILQKLKMFNVYLLHELHYLKVVVAISWCEFERTEQFWFWLKKFLMKSLICQNFGKLHDRKIHEHPNCSAVKSDDVHIRDLLPVVSNVENVEK